ncbi:MAG: hypothetical protein ACK456_02895 [Pseudanabaenaceae cyanobacterium]|jgi:hypothetical protein
MNSSQSLFKRVVLFTTTAILSAFVCTSAYAYQTKSELSGAKIAQAGLARRVVRLSWIAGASRGATLLSRNGRVFRTSRGSVMGPYNSLRNWVPTNLPGGGEEKYNGRNAHHLIPKAHARILFPNENTDQMPAVNVPRRDHMEKYHARLNSEMANIRRRFPDLNNPEARGQIWRAYQRVYAEHPDWLEAISGYFD